MHKTRTADSKEAAAFMEFARRQIETGKFPETAALFRDVDPGDVSDQVTGIGVDAKRFESGLEALLDGAEVRMRAKARARRRTTKRKKKKKKA
jgi:hypothetical protein